MAMHGLTAARGGRICFQHYFMHGRPHAAIPCSVPPQVHVYSFAVQTETERRRDGSIGSSVVRAKPREVVERTYIMMHHRISTWARSSIQPAGVSRDV